MDKKTPILQHGKIEQKIDRMAWQIMEDHFQEPRLIVIGIAERGYHIALRLTEILRTHFAGELQLGVLTMNKSEPMAHEITTDISPENFDDSAIILVDDVLQSGRTMMYAAKHLLNAPVKCLSTAVLVNRKHLQFPIRANYVGLTLSTTIQEQVRVEINDQQEMQAYLTA